MSLFATDYASGQSGGDLIYSVNRTPELTFNTARAAQVIDGDALRQSNARTLPEALMLEAGVFVQQTNYGGGSPIIRGQMGKQVLLLVDGIKLNNATYRFGPLQYLSTIDLNLVERVEFVRGVGSVLGSDALGGVINIITKKGPTEATSQPIGIEAGVRYASAASATTVHGAAFGQSQQFRYHVGGTYRTSQDLRGGQDVGTQQATGYDEAAAHVSGEYFVSDDRMIAFRYQFLEQQDVPRTDRITSGRNLVFDFDPQRLNLASLVYQDLTDRGWSDHLQLTLYLNQQREDRQEIRTNNPSVTQMFSDDQAVWGLNVEMGAFLGAQRLLYGIDLSTESIHSTRNDLNRDTGTVTPKHGNFTDGASYQNLATYIQDSFNLAMRLKLTVGLRYNVFAAQGEENSAVGTLNLDSRRSDFTGAVNALFSVSDQLNLMGSVTRGFRAPNLDDLSVFDERGNGTEVPNPDIASEKILMYEGGIKVAQGRLSGSAVAYYSTLSDLLVRSAGTSKGLSFFDLNSNGVQDAAEPDVLQKKNLGEVTIWGMEWDARYLLLSSLAVFGNATYTWGQDNLAEEPLQRIPPAFGTLGVRWSNLDRHKSWVEGLVHVATDQRRLSAGDISDSRIGPDGTDGFRVFHLRGGFTVVRPLQLTLALENLTDAQYKYHGSGIYRPGRQAVIGAQLSL